MDGNLRNESSGVDIDKLVSGFLRRRKAFFITFAISIGISMLAVFLIPATYKSQSTILIEQQEIPEELVRSTVTSYADQRIETISQRVFSTANLWKIVEKYELYGDERKKETREYIIGEMRNEAIKRNVISAEVVDPRSGRPTEATIAFQLSFTYENPALAQRVANELTTLFLSENLKTRTEMAEQASVFLSNEVDKLDLKVATLEQELASFKTDNFDSLPELTDLNIRLLDRTEQSVRENQLAQSGVRERIIYLQSELAQIEPFTKVLVGDGKRLLSSKARLQFSKQELEQAKSKYSNLHPTVKRLESEIASLLLEVGDEEAPKLKLEIYEQQLADLRRQYSDDHPSVMSLKLNIERLQSIGSFDRSTASAEGADNPAYLQLKAQLEASQLELESLDKQGRLLVADLKKYEQRIGNAPLIEQRYQQLTRDYQSAVLKYAEVKAKQEEANLGRSLESEQKGERFTLIEPALVPEEPNSPNRKFLGVVAFLLSVGFSVAVVVVKEILDKSIRGRKELLTVIGAPPLAVIPIISTRGDLASVRQTRLILAAVAIVGIVSVLALFHVFVKPLDVTWYIALRKFGLM